MKRRGHWAVLLPMTLSGGSLGAQTAGEIGGLVTDDQGLAVPGVTVRLEGDVLIAPLAALTLADGSYRFRALGRGSYDLAFERAGFRTLIRRGVMVEGSRAIRIDAPLAVAAVAETITVTGDAPVLDMKRTALVNDFGAAELQEVPSATDVWAVLGQTAGVRMRGFDVGGSHKSQQTGYESFGIRGQNRVLADGVDTTEGDGGTGFYFDYYIMLFSMPAAGEIASDNRNRHHAVFIQDTWRPVDRLSLNLGVRYEQQRTYFLDAVSTPFLADFFPSGTARGRTHTVWNTWAPRLGLAFSLASRTVLRGHYGRYYLNLADAHEVANPASTAWIRLFNSNAVTNFSLRTGDRERIIAALDPIVMKLGIRFQF